MSDSEALPSSSEDSLLNQINRICDQAEELWRNGQSPVLEELLGQLPADGRKNAFAELLTIELQYRHQRGHRLKQSKYLERFPDFEQDIESAFSLVQVTPDESATTGEHTNTPNPLQGSPETMAEEPAEQPDSKAPPTIGQYELLEELGAGGMGRVYKAQHCHLGKVVAIKVLSDEFSNNPRAVARFRREMRAVGALDHPNIVRATDAGETNGTHFLVMDYEEGIDLQKLLNARRHIPIPLACELMRQACDALEYARGQGRIHRDIKPGNLLVCRGKMLKILDFGLARLLQGEASQDGSMGPISREDQILGTPDYMSPEQAAGNRELDVRSDIYSLGCTFYALLAGRAPFGTPEYKVPIRKMWAHMEQDPKPIEELNPDVPGEIAGLIRGMMAKKLEDRYQTPGEVSLILQSFLQGTKQTLGWKEISHLLPTEEHEDEETQDPATDAVDRHLAMTEAVNTPPPEKPKPTRPTLQSELQTGSVVGPACKLEKLVSQSGADELWQASGGGGGQNISLLVRDLEKHPADSVRLNLLSILRQGVIRHARLHTLRAFWLLDDDLRPINKNMHILLESGKARKLVMGGRACSKSLLETMASYCESGQPMPLSEVLSALEQIADAFDYLNRPQHQIGNQAVAFVYSNLHPINVLYAEEENSYRVANYANLRGFMGNWIDLSEVGPVPEFPLMAPELRQGKVTLRSDQYSLALLYLWMRSNLPPWEETQVQEKLLAHLKEPQPDLVDIAPAEKALLMRALDTDPSNRFASCQDLIYTLKAVASATA